MVRVVEESNGSRMVYGIPMLVRDGQKVCVANRMEKEGIRGLTSLAVGEVEIRRGRGGKMAVVVLGDNNIEGLRLTDGDDKTRISEARVYGARVKNVVEKACAEKEVWRIKPLGKKPYE